MSQPHQILECPGLTTSTMRAKVCCLHVDNGHTALYGCRHDLAGRLFECIPNVNPDTRPRKDGTACRIGTRYGNEQPATNTNEGEQNHKATHLRNYVRLWTIRR